MLQTRILDFILCFGFDIKQGLSILILLTAVAGAFGSYLLLNPGLVVVCLQEFVDVSPPQRNWKGIAISLLVIVVVCSLITMSVVVLTPGKAAALCSSDFLVPKLLGVTVCCVSTVEVPGGSRSRLTVADLYKPEFSIHDPEATWISGEYASCRPRTRRLSLS